MIYFYAGVLFLFAFLCGKWAYVALIWGQVGATALLASLVLLFAFWGSVCIWYARKEKK